jgi:leucine dehydrogenase
MATRTPTRRVAVAPRVAAEAFAPFSAMAAGGHEEVVLWRDRTTGLRAVVAIHDTTLGPALGGTRMYPYSSEREALEDVLRLSRAMTYKNAAAGLDVGGGKAVIIGDPAQDKSEALFRAYGRFIESLGGRYVTTTDVGTTVPDLDIMRHETVHVAGCSPAMGGSGDTSVLTGLTVYRGMQAAAEAAWGSRALSMRSVLIQGAGKVGVQLIRHLRAEGTKLLVADLDPARAKRAADDFGAIVVPMAEVFDTPCDIFSPNALGGTLNDDTIPRLRCTVVCGGANNQLAEERHARTLAERGILYAPDFIVNCGGVINVAEELMGYDPDRATARAERVYETTLRVLARAREAGITPEEAAVQLAEQRIRTLGEIKRTYLP